MTFSGLPQLQAAVVAKLRGDATLMALVTGVHDDVPELKKFPYIVFDDPMESPARVFGQDGHRSSFTLSVYTQDGSATKKGTGAAGYKQGMAIAELVLGLLTNPLTSSALVVSGHDVVDVDVDELQYSRLTDGVTRVVDIPMTADLEDNPLIP